MLTLNNSLYFISRHFKQFSVPKVIICEYDECDHPYYGWYLNCVYKIDNYEIYNDKGLIVIPRDLKWDFECTLLHEYRHHIQFNIHGYWSNVTDNQNVFERDARLFEVSLAKLDEFTDEFKTVKVDRSHMLNLPSKSFLSSLVQEN